MPYKNKEDQKAFMKAYRDARKEETAIYNKEYAKANRERRREYIKANAEANAEAIAERNRKYSKANAKAIAKQRREYRLTPEARVKKNASHAKRRAAKLERTPPWLTKQHLEDIRAFYEWSEYLDGPHEVDHIVPLQGELVSGLHVPWNLRVLTKDEHKYKLNKFEV